MQNWYVPDWQVASEQAVALAASHAASRLEFEPSEPLALFQALPQLPLHV